MLSVVLRSTLATAISVALLASVQTASAADVSADKIVEALKPRKSRGLSVKPTQAEIERAKTIEDLKSKAATRALSVPERNELAEAVKDKPSIDIEILFEFNSAAISPKSRNALESLAAALKHDSLKEASVLIAGHTDAKGRAEYNQSLSERRAQAVRDYLLKNHNITASLTVVGYGAEKLKVPSSPYSGDNRRVQFVNLTDNRVSQNTK